MALRVSTAKRKKKQVLRTKNFRVPGETWLYWQGVGAGLLAFFIFAGIVLWFAHYESQRAVERSRLSDQAMKELQDSGLSEEEIKKQLALAQATGGQLIWQPAAALAAWPLVTLLLLPPLACQSMRRRLKEAGLRAKVMGNNYPEIQQLVRSQCAVLGLKEPGVYVLDDELAFVSVLSGGRPAIVITRPALDTLTGDELAAAFAQQLGHIKARHVRMMNLVTYIRGAKRIWHAVWLPASIMTIVLQGWSDVAEWTADRCALLLTGRPQAVNAAMVKLALEADALAQIDSRELRDYLSAGGELATDAEQVERHFRIGTFITDTPGLTERIRTLSEFARSDEAREAFEKVTEIRAA